MEVVYLSTCFQIFLSPCGETLSWLPASAVVWQCCMQEASSSIFLHFYLTLPSSANSLSVPSEVRHNETLRLSHRPASCWRPVLLLILHSVWLFLAPVSVVETHDKHSQVAGFLSFSFKSPNIWAVNIHVLHVRQDRNIPFIQYSKRPVNLSHVSCALMHWEKHFSAEL